MNIGVDIGGSHIGIGIVNNNGKILEKIEHKINYVEKINIQDFLINEIIDTIKKWISEKKENVEKIGIGAPGIVKNNIIEFSVNLSLNKFDLKSKIQKEFSDSEIIIKNDAKCAGLAEKNLGSLRKYDDCIFLCLGTGIGGAGFYNGKLISPKNGSGFEFGHTIIQKNGEQCKCGSKGCFELYGSMRKFKNDIRFGLDLPENIDGSELVEIVKQHCNDENILKIIDDYLQNLCIGISNFIDILQPQAVCLGGSFVYYKDILLDKFVEKLNSGEYIFYKEKIPDIVVAKLGNDAGIIGSVMYI